MPGNLHRVRVAGKTWINLIRELDGQSYTLSIQRGSGRASSRDSYRLTADEAMGMSRFLAGHESAGDLPIPLPAPAPDPKR